jgi:hypothetical protein
VSLKAVPKASYDSEFVSKAGFDMIHWKKSTNDSEGKPEQNS